MLNISIIGAILIIVNLAFSYQGFKNQLFFEGYKFEVDRILINKDYKRLVTSGFLHVNWAHLIINMISLYLFADQIDFNLGSVQLLLIYFLSLIGGNLLALYIHRNHGDYNAVGASGAISGVIFASIAVFPNLGISFWGIPFSIPSWLYSLLYVLYSIYGIKSQKDNIGHEAHLGGAIIGMIVALVLNPEAFANNYFIILMVMLPALMFIGIIIKKPTVLLTDSFNKKNNEKYYSIDDKYHIEKSNHQKEIDRILDKISEKGLDSLTDKEKEILKGNH